MVWITRDIRELTTLSEKYAQWNFTLHVGVLDPDEVSICFTASIW